MSVVGLSSVLHYESFRSIRLSVAESGVYVKPNKAGIVMILRHFRLFVICTPAHLVAPIYPSNCLRVVSYYIKRITPDFIIIGIYIYLHC